MISSRNSISTVLEFIDCINEGNPKRLITLQTEDFTLIDMAGDRFVGRDDWKGYFSEYPEYKIHVQQILLSGEGVAIIGKTTGSHVDSRVEVLETVLWIAEVRDGLIASWRIYSDIDESKRKLGLD